MEPSGIEHMTRLGFGMGVVGFLVGRHQPNDNRKVLAKCRLNAFRSTVCIAQSGMQV